MHIRLADYACHKSDIFNLCIDVQGTVQNLLDNVRNPVRTVNVGIQSLFIDEGLVAHGLEKSPHRGKVLNNVDNGVRLNIEVACIKPAADCQSRNMFHRFVLGVGGVAHGVTVMNADIHRGLHCIVHVGTSVPHAVGFVHFHVVHVDHEGNIHGRMPLVAVDALVNRERIGFGVAVLDGVKPRSLDVAEIDGRIVVTVVENTPVFHCGFLGYGLGAVCIHSHDIGGGLNFVILVEFDDGHFFLCRSITDLGNTDIRLPDPVLIDARFEVPFQHFARLVGGKQRANYKCPVLCKMAAVIQTDFFIGGNAETNIAVFRCQHDAVAGGKRFCNQKFAASAVIKRRFSEKLRNLFRYGMNFRIMLRILRKNHCGTVHKEILPEIVGREKFQIHAGFADQILRNRLVEENLKHQSFVFRGHANGGSKVVIAVRQFNGDAVVLRIHLSVRHRAVKVPLFRGIHEADSAAARNSFTALDDFDAGLFFIAETAGVSVAVNKYV